MIKDGDGDGERDDPGDGDGEMRKEERVESGGATAAAMAGGKQSRGSC